jgi:hypothetical protein
MKPPQGMEKRFKNEKTTTENLCLDAGEAGKAQEVSARGSIPPIRPRGEEISESERNLDFIPRRWIVECFHSWMNRFRKLIPRYEKNRSLLPRITPSRRRYAKGSSKNKPYFLPAQTTEKDGLVLRCFYMV